MWGTQDQEGCESVFGFKWLLQTFIPHYSIIAAVLIDQTRKDQPAQVKWTEECGEALVKLKAALSCGPVLHSPDYGHEFVVQTDASDWGMGAVLCQVDENREEHPIVYYSRKFLPREERYSTVEKECLAVKLGIQAFRVHILGRKFTVMTDHRALEWMNKMKAEQLKIDSVEFKLKTL